MHRWRYPSLSLHGIEGAFSGSGAKTVIPRKVVGKFSIRLVPNMTPEVVSEQACRHGGARRAAVPEEMVTEGPRGPPTGKGARLPHTAPPLALPSSAISRISRSDPNQR